MFASFLLFVFLYIHACGTTETRYYCCWHEYAKLRYTAVVVFVMLSLERIQCVAVQCSTAHSSSDSEDVR
jgi:hypothetical protein